MYFLSERGTNRSLYGFGLRSSGGIGNSIRSLKYIFKTVPRMCRLDDLLAILHTLQKRASFRLISCLQMRLQVNQDHPFTYFTWIWRDQISCELESGIMSWGSLMMPWMESDPCHWFCLTVASTWQFSLCIRACIKARIFSSYRRREKSHAREILALWRTDEDA